MEEVLFLANKQKTSSDRPQATGVFPDAR